MPEKVGDVDKTGLLQTEDVVYESSRTGTQEAGGVVGTDADADEPRYVNDDGTGEEVDDYTSGSASRTWLYNELKEQRQVDPGFLEDTSIGIIILTDNTSVAQADLYRLVANSAGIPVDEADDRITIIRDPECDHRRACPASSAASVPVTAQETKEEGRRTAGRRL